MGLAGKRPRLQNIILEQLADLSVGPLEKGQPHGDAGLAEDLDGFRLHGYFGARGPSPLQSGIAVVGSKAKVENGALAGNTAGNGVSLEYFQIITVTGIEHTSPAGLFPPLDGELEAEGLGPEPDGSVPLGSANCNVMEPAAGYLSIVMYGPAHLVGPFWETLELD